MILVKSSGANKLVKHGVPPMKEPCGSSGSIVFRKIKTVIPWDKVLKKVETAKKLKRKREKEKKQEEGMEKERGEVLNGLNQTAREKGIHPQWESWDDTNKLGTK